MRRGSTSRILRPLTLIFAIGVLGVLALQLSQGRFTPAQTTEATATFLSSDNLTEQAVATLRGAGINSPVPEIVTASSGPTLIGPSTPADGWANLLLDRIIPILEGYRPSSDGFAWWQGSDANARLRLVDLASYLGTEPFIVGIDQSLQLSVPDPELPDHLKRVASILPDEAAVTLTISASGANESDTRWILSNAEPDLAIQALIIQAAARGFGLRAVYLPNPAADDELALLGLEAFSQAAGVGEETPSIPLPSATSMPTALPTATRVPEPGMGQVLRDALGPAVDMTLLIPETVTQSVVDRHPWTGLLTWTETGPQINQRALNVDQAGQLTFYTISPDDPQGTALRALTAVYTGSTTRLPDLQTIFQGHRMEEILYWLVLIAVDHDGQLYVAYDDFGSQQAITFIGFQPFPAGND